MFSRYVDGLATFAPNDPEMYKAQAKKIAEETGYALAKPHRIIQGICFLFLLLLEK
jgi:hypothetical protein